MESMQNYHICITEYTLNIKVVWAHLYSKTIPKRVVKILYGTVGAIFQFQNIGDLGEKSFKFLKTFSQLTSQAQKIMPQLKTRELINLDFSNVKHHPVKRSRENGNMLIRVQNGVSMGCGNQ